MMVSGLVTPRLGNTRKQDKHLSCSISDRRRSSVLAPFQLIMKCSEDETVRLWRPLGDRMSSKLNTERMAP